MALFDDDRNGAAHTAWACVIYSMVPYLGIIFVPLALIASGVGFAASRKPQAGGRKLALISFWGAMIALVIQVFLWWLLYFIPTLHHLEGVFP